MVFQGFWDMQPSWNVVSSTRPHYGTFKEHRKTHGVWSISGYAALSEFLLFVRRSKFIQNSLKIAPRSRKNAPKRPKTSNMAPNLQHGASIMPKRGPKRSPRHVRRVSERGFKSDFNLCSHGGAIKNSEGSSENATSFHDGIQDAEITCLLKTMLFQMSWVGG